MKFRLGKGAGVVALAATMLVLAASAAYAHRLGRMTGGGRIDTASGIRVTHGFELHCINRDGGQKVEMDPNNLEVNWPEANNWHLEDLTKGACHDEGFDQGQPQAPFDTYYGEGFGRLNGVSGAFACWRLVDDGEPGSSDIFRFRVWAAGAAPNPANSANDPGKCPRPDSAPVLDTGGRRLNQGNHQAHRLTGNDARAG